MSKLIVKLAVVNIAGNATHVRTTKPTFKNVYIHSKYLQGVKWDTGKLYSYYGEYM